MTPLQLETEDLIELVSALAELTSAHELDHRRNRVPPTPVMRPGDCPVPCPPAVRWENGVAYFRPWLKA